ncbi:MAG: MerR family transcriptional regulator [Anaerostipes sp.]|nr:MerR family transcriptional regulator [Anaerostipes sp.]MDD3747156.1 MerR family transcriptional regulator [Anaerostipes sp.]
MSKEKNTWFTIGQFADMHGINKKTLMWYDEVGLFRPVKINETNGYRYYSYHQSMELETILLLRDMKVSIGDIQKFMENRCAESMECLLKGKITELEESIKNLKSVQSQLSNRHEDMIELLNIDLSGINIIEKEPQYLMTVETTPTQSSEEDIEAVIAKIKEYNLPRMYQASYGSMILVESLYAGDFDNYMNLFIQLPKEEQEKALHIQPGGNYIQAFCKGSWDKLPLRYAELLEYAKAHHLQLSGYAYETGINEMVIDTMEDYITKIEIPVLYNKKKSKGGNNNEIK